MLLFYIFIFLVSCLFFYFAGKMVVDGLVRVTKFLKLKEFVVAFFVIAVAASLPNLIIGLSSAARAIPQLSFGDVTGNNLAALTLGIALACLFAKGGIPAESRTVRATSFFVMVSALLPLLLILDGTLSRIDGVLLIALFTYYVFWLFSKEERFNKPYDDYTPPAFKGFKFFLKDLLKIFLGLIMFIIAAQGIVSSAQFFAKDFNVSLILIGVLITGLGSALPEIYFDIVSVRRGQTWMVLGDVMGAVIIPSTLVLGIVALVSPIHIFDFSSLVLARFFVIAAALCFPIFIRSGQKINKKEALILFSIYIIFLITEILFRNPLINNTWFNFLVK